MSHTAVRQSCEVILPIFFSPGLGRKGTFALEFSKYKLEILDILNQK